jgi:hypothetical protein
MLPLALSISSALKVDMTELSAVYKNRRDEFEAAVKDVVEKYDFFRLFDSNKLEFKGLDSRTPDEMSMPGSDLTIGQHFDACFPLVKGRQDLPCIHAYDAKIQRQYFAIEELVVFPKL